MRFEELNVYDTAVNFGDALIKLYHIQSRTNPYPVPDKTFHQHFYYELHLMTKGIQSFTVEGNTQIPVRATQMLIISPFTMHYPFTQKEENEEIILILTIEQTSGDSGFFACLSSALKENSQRPIDIPTALFSKLLSFHTLFAATGTRDICRRSAFAYEIVFGLFDVLNAFEQNGKITEHAQKENLFIALEYFVSEKSFSLSDIAKRLGYTPRHTARLIKQIYGKSLSVLRRESALAAAGVLLQAKPHASPDEIAAEAGFPSGTAMVRALAKQSIMSSEAGPCTEREC